MKWKNNEKKDKKKKKPKSTWANMLVLPPSLWDHNNFIKKIFFFMKLHFQQIKSWSDVKPDGKSPRTHKKKKKTQES